MPVHRPTTSPSLRPAQRGFVLIVTSVAIVLLLGVAGLAVDIGRMYVIRAELQSFTDAAALSAAVQLDGTRDGVDRARSDASRFATGTHAMRWDMGTQPITGTTTSFSADRATWFDQPKQLDARFVRVVASEPAPIIFLRIVQPFSSTMVTAASVGTKTDQTARLIQ